LAKSHSHHYPGLGYKDVSGAEAAFKTIQKLFSNLSNLKKVTCWISETFYY